MRLFLVVLCAIHTLCAAEKGFITVDKQRIEVFTLIPQGKGPFPVIFLLHGYQPPQSSIGGLELVEFQYLERFEKEGIAAVSISLPGYGNSEGVRDFSGPQSQKAASAVIKHFSALPFIDPHRMGIYGLSRGAIAASMVHRYCPELALQILEGGWYDLAPAIFLMPEYLQGIKDNILQETGGGEEALKERSAIFYTPSTLADTLILHGEYDDRRGLVSAKILHEKLIAEGKCSYLKVFPAETHRLPMEKWETIIPFVRERFFHLYGIGVKLSGVWPVFQIIKIHAGSPAEGCGKLKVGDAILSISPHNNEEEIEALRMPMQKFLQLMLGEKGSSVRLRVQHFDLKVEDIVVERG